MDQSVRNKLRNVVTQCRKLLEDATAQALQGRFGIYGTRRKGDVQVEDEARMGHLSDEDRACRQELLDHLEHIKALGYKPSDALDHLIREIAFTHLNRLCAYKMMESRGLIREAVSRGLKSQGFFFYLSDHPEDEKLHNGGRQEAAYRNFLDWLGGTLSEEIGVLFNPNDPANRIYPPQRALDGVLALINDGELSGIWSQDETIGWVYQYFTPKELRDKARKESEAPRNAYELAFRNQFFTPRYVVEFLTDNTLGRIWYEMRKGETSLKERCRYLVRRPTEVFLAEGEEAPAEAKETRDDLSQEELLRQPVHIPHRPKKDPREIKVLDPACGSGHFLLYCFDLLQVIYEEAYDDPDLDAALRKDYPALEDLRREVPGLILKHNLHGIDIDLRATQIAALALWLRCQRAYQELGLKNGERPKVTRSNIVCAEPMPGETDLLKEFTATLQPKVLGQLVEVVFEKMKLAGEVGSLLKIEEEIRHAAHNARAEYVEWKKHQEKARGHLFPEMVKREQPGLFDLADLTEDAFLDRGEEEIVSALRQYAENAANGRAFRRRLFAEDAAHGFAFVDLCRKRFDVVLMNPPFGEAAIRAQKYQQEFYSRTKNDIYAASVERGVGLLSERGGLGAITSRTGFFLKRFQAWREEILLTTVCPIAVADFGPGVLDTAAVETAGYAVLKGYSGPATFIKADEAKDKDALVRKALLEESSGRVDGSLFYLNPQSFRDLPESKWLYWLPSALRSVFVTLPTLRQLGFLACAGLQTNDDFRFVRASWEVPREELVSAGRWASFYKGGEFSPYFDDIHLAVNWYGNGRDIKQHTIALGNSPSRHVVNEQHYFKAGYGYVNISSIGFSPQVFPKGVVFSIQGQYLGGNPRPPSLALLASSTVAVLLDIINPGRHYQAGQVQLLPLPSNRIDSKTEDHALEVVSLKRAQCGWLEDSRNFLMPFGLGSENALRESWRQMQKVIGEQKARIERIQEGIDGEVLSAYALDKEAARHVAEEIKQSRAHPGFFAVSSLAPHVGSEAQLSQWLTTTYISYCVGVGLGRWDIRFATGERQPPELLDPFASLPVCPPGMLQGPDGLPAKPEDVPLDYPVRIDWDGILVDDPEHDDDVVRRVRDVLEMIWKEGAEAIEKEICEILGARELRDCFRKPGNGGFWVDHVKRYSKSRRNAPIYWYLRSSKGNYGLWLYYHRVDKDIFFKALVNYVEPKIRLEEDRLKTLRARKEAAGSSGREAKQIEKDMDRQEQFISELHDFKDKLRRAADLHVIPDLNDGVVLNIAPLWELVPWNEAKQYWEDLLEGKYEWSSIGKQLREKGLVK